MIRTSDCFLIDANVLFSVVKREIILSMALDGLIEVRWSEAILDEMKKALHRYFIKKHGNVLEATRNSLRVYNWVTNKFPTSLVEGDLPTSANLIELPDPADAHVVRSAILCKANVIVTDNVRHFPQSIVNRYGIEVKTADEVISDVIDAEPDISILIVTRIYNRLQNPKRSWKEFLETWETDHRLIKTADKLRQVTP